MVCTETLWKAIVKLRIIEDKRSELSTSISFKDGQFVLSDSDGDHFVNQELEDLSLCVLVQTHFHSLFEI